jgi:hypothetical protein
MFNFVHHVRILVHNADDMVTYLEQTFSLLPTGMREIRLSMAYSHSY